MPVRPYIWLLKDTITIMTRFVCSVTEVVLETDRVEEVPEAKPTPSAAPPAPAVAESTLAAQRLDASSSHSVSLKVESTSNSSFC